ERFQEWFKNLMYNHNFKTGDLVLIRNSRQDGPLHDKMQSQYMGPYIVVKQRSRGAYIVAELLFGNQLKQV
ncbi:hypothetical protein DACRYDRAFT_48649, partial [Dacryopinax primogenitus]